MLSLEVAHHDAAPVHVLQPVEHLQEVGAGSGGHRLFSWMSRVSRR